MQNGDTDLLENKLTSFIIMGIIHSVNGGNVIYAKKASSVAVTVVLPVAKAVNVCQLGETC